MGKIRSGLEFGHPHPVLGHAQGQEGESRSGSKEKEGPSTAPFFVCGGFGLKGEPPQQDLVLRNCFEQKAHSAK